MRSILVIDDFKDMRTVISDILTDAGYAVTLAEDSYTADERCRNSSFDLVLCDMILPIVDDIGLGLSDTDLPVGLHIICKLSRSHPHIPVVAMSGKFDKDLIEKAKYYGAATLLPKPFTSDELLEAVDRVVGLYHDPVDLSLTGLS